MVEEGVRRWWFPNAERKGGQSEPDLVEGDHSIEVKARSDTRQPEYLVKQLIRGKINNKEPVRMIIVSYDTKSVNVRFWEVRYIEQEVTRIETETDTMIDT